METEAAKTFRLLYFMAKVIALQNCSLFFQFLIFLQHGGNVKDRKAGCDTRRIG